MIPFDQIDSRLAAINRDRKWLVEASKRSAGAVRSALAPNASPQHRSELLQKALSDAIEAEEAAQNKKPILPERISLEPSREIFQLWDKASRVEGADSLEDWIITALTRAAKREAEDNTIVSMPAPPTRANILAAAGSPIYAEVMDWNGAGDTVLVKISGLSMAPLLNDGETVPMRLKTESRPFMKKGLIYLVNYDGGFLVKRYNTRKPTPEEKGEEWVENGRVKVLESINPEFPEIIIKDELNWIAWLEESKI